MNSWAEFGEGMVAWDIVIAGLLTAATVLQLAVCRDKGICESRMAGACRWLLVAATGIFAGRRWLELAVDHDAHVSVPGLVGFALLSVGLIGLALDRIWRRVRERENDRRTEDDRREKLRRNPQ